MFTGHKEKDFPLKPQAGIKENLIERLDPSYDYEVRVQAQPNTLSYKRQDWIPFRKGYNSLIPAQEKRRYRALKGCKGERKGENPRFYSKIRIAFWLSIIQGICMPTSVSGILKTNDYTTRMNESRGPILVPKEGNITHILKKFTYNGRIRTQSLHHHRK